MSNDPAFLFYDGDAARDVSHMSRLERGCYFDIIQAQKKFGRLSEEIIKKILGKDFETCWESVKICLSYVEHMYFIEWLENSINKRKLFCESRKNNKTVKKGHHMLNICESYDEHMVNANAIEDVIKKEDEKEIEKRNQRKRDISGHVPDISGHSASASASASASGIKEKIKEEKAGADQGLTRGCLAPLDKDKDKDKDKDRKRIKKEFIPPTYEEFKNYCTENGFENIAERAFKGYSEAAWHDAKGQPIFNWKQKLQNGWFREENKNSQNFQPKYGRQEVSTEDLKSQALRLMEKHKNDL